MFRQEEFMGRRVLRSSLLGGYKNVDAFFTTRDLPLKYAEREDLIEEVEQNKKLLSIGFCVPQENIFIPEQTHSDNVEIIDLNKHVYPVCDALITNKLDIVLALNFADCVPLIFFDPEKNIVASAHAGWRGAVAKIGSKTVDKMVKEYSSEPQNIIALIGPAIGSCCFEVGDDVKSKIIHSASNYHSDNNFIDLKEVNKIQLLASGIEKIDVCEYCTSCQNELFFSYRKEKAHTARHSAVVIMKSEI